MCCAPLRPPADDLLPGSDQDLADSGSHQTRLLPECVLQPLIDNGTGTPLECESCMRREGVTGFAYYVEAWHSLGHAMPEGGWHTVIP